MPEDSCDVALEELARSELELTDAYGTMVALAATSAVSVFAFLAAVGILVLTLGILGTPAGPLGWTMVVGVGVVAALTGAVAVFGLAALVSAYFAWEAAKRHRLQAYAAVQAKCPANRTPPPPST